MELGADFGVSRDFSIISEYVATISKIFICDIPENTNVRKTPVERMQTFLFFAPETLRDEEICATNDMSS